MREGRGVQEGGGEEKDEEKTDESITFPHVAVFSFAASSARYLKLFSDSARERRRRRRIRGGREKKGRKKTQQAALTLVSFLSRPICQSASDRQPMCPTADIWQDVLAPSHTQYTSSVAARGGGYFPLQHDLLNCDGGGGRERGGDRPDVLISYRCA